MNSHTIDAKTFQKLFLAGANRINSRKDYINELNVFPVPDGDTGTNTVSYTHLTLPTN